MTSIVRLVERTTAFDPEETEILIAAFDNAWAQLCASGSECARPAYSRAMREVLARRVIDVARRGVMDAGHITTEVLRFLAANYRHEARREAS
jgi:hypothetical protein